MITAESTPTRDYLTATRVVLGLHVMRAEDKRHFLKGAQYG